MTNIYPYPGPATPNGLYLYSTTEKRWIQLERFWLSENGVHVIYFDNTLCPACRKFDKTWFTFVEQNAEKARDTYFMIALCDWFAGQCGSEPARRLFEIFDVHVSPTIVFLIRKGGELKKSLKHEGVMDMEKLAMTLAVLLSLNV
ncbi:hypothetical protein [Infirmifilum sp.]|uniref:hypothetical protein n=1 Tax=Infirmifilum sp. TaxID=2856575 RepID=UPI003D0983BB